MFKHKVDVSGDYVQGEINKNNGNNNEYDFKLVQYWITEGLSINAQKLREFAAELNNTALELDKLNGKNTLIR